MPITSQGVTLNLELVVVDYLKATMNQTITMISVQNPFPTSLARHLTTAALARL